MSRFTLRTRLLVPLLVLLLIGLVGAPVLSSVVMTRHFDDRVDERLVATSRTIGGLLSGRPSVSVSEARVSRVPTAGGLLLVALDQEGRVAFVVDRRDPDASGTGVDGLVAAALDHPAAETLDSHVEGTSYGVVRAVTPGLTVRTEDRGDVAIAQVVVAIDRSEDEAVVGAVRRAGVVFAIVAMLVLGVLAVVAVGRGLRPLTRMALLADAAGGERDGTAPDGFRHATRGSAPELERLGSALADAFEARARAEESVRAFMLDASHELRTPLTSISGWLDLYAQGGLSDPAELERAMERMESEVGRMRLLVEELDLLARMDQGRPLDLDDVPLDALLEGLVEDARVVDPDREIRFDGGDVVVRADRRRLEQAIGNLVGNALHHTPPGTPLEVRVAVEEGLAAIAVVDHGAGFGDADLDRVFERFHRAESVRREPGTGLGLAIARAIAEAHGGSATAAATPGGGATVTVRIPTTVSQPSGSR